eukprot:TRINITY_DN124203_c0_g1_i1.p6 TRINITY_DN124203_c0_g1~~TRINITY_DN124203_c0_g1_i1.p6  ORF type:complete len:102 (+),score=4.65 TRINITY_DN124203_c0_g1_i1:663-968(+)
MLFPSLFIFFLIAEQNQNFVVFGADADTVEGKKVMQTLGIAKLPYISVRISSNYDISNILYQTVSKGISNNNVGQNNHEQGTVFIRTRKCCEELSCDCGKN